MHKFLFSIVLLFPFFFNLLKAQATFPPPPNPPQVIIDDLQMLSIKEKSFLSNFILQNQKATSNEILVYITNDINNMEPADFCVGLGRAWGVGSKEYNNGIILLILKSTSRRVIWLSTGYGLEGALPDVVCKQITEDVIKPYFKSSQYFTGIQKGLEAVVQATKGEYKNLSPKKKKKSRKKELFGVIIFVIIMVLIYSSRNRRGGGGKGGRRRNGAVDIFTGLLIGSAMGGMMGGGRRGGFGGGGGGFGGGGFGGFGGGGFGGGGAGSSW